MAGRPSVETPIGYNVRMEHELLTVQKVNGLQDGGKRWLESVLGEHLNESQQVFIMVFTVPKPESAALQRRLASRCWCRGWQDYWRCP